ncbi:DUF397 domain-containing protein [Streptomyces griseocarneus]|nr:DUF397 domain-containing protein [Streptomyces griseocarneus]
MTAASPAAPGTPPRTPSDAASRAAPPWQRSRSSGSGGGNECLEAAHGPDGRLRFRESDHLRTVLAPAPHAWAALLRAVKTGALDRVSR